MKGGAADELDVGHVVGEVGHGDDVDGRHEFLEVGKVGLARKVGGIAATLIDYALEVDRGNSFLFHEFNSTALEGVIENAISVMDDQEKRAALIAQAVRAEND